MKHVLQITPYLPPKVSGVGDYAFIIAKGLRERHGWQTTFLVAHSNQGQTEIERFPVLSLNNRNGTDLSAVLQKHNRILLQYVGYGFQRRGCPLWLLQGLQKWKRNKKDANLTTMFHELYASGPPWRSSFWTSLMQKSICSKLSQLSDGCVTNLLGSQKQLETFRDGEPAIFLPVFSNVGEPDFCMPHKDRKSRLILFGGYHKRKTAVTIDRKDFEKTCRSLGIQEILDIGPGQVPDPQIANTKWHSLGVLEVNDISTLMQESLAGFVSYPSFCLGKSGIFAGYSAHGLICVIPSRCLKNKHNDLIDGIDFFTPLSIKNLSYESMDTLLTNVFLRYQKFSQANQSRHFDILLGK